MNAMRNIIRWSKIPYISYDYLNDSCLSHTEKAEISKAYDALQNAETEKKYKYIAKKIRDKENFVSRF